MEQLNQILQGFLQDISRRLLILFILTVQSSLDDFDVPITVLVPNYFIYLLSGQTQLELVQGLGHCFCGRIHSGNHPFVLILENGGRFICHRQEIAVLILQVHDGEPGCVPQLVGEVSGGLQTAGQESGIVTRRNSGAQHESQCIRTVLVDDNQRIDSVAQRFTHLPTLFITYQTVQEYVLERDFMHRFACGEYHSDDPEEQDIVSGYHNGSRIEVIQFRRLLRPAQCGERPQCRTEPGVQNILILMEVVSAALRAGLRHVVCHHQFTALIAVVRRNPVSPPQLTGNAPVVNIVQPIQINFLKSCRNVLQLSGSCRLDGRFCQIFHLYEPLIRQHRLNGVVAAVTFTHRNDHIFRLNQITGLFQLLYPRLPALITVHAFVFAGQLVHGGIFIHAAQDFKIVTGTHLEVVRVVCRRNLHRTGSLLRIRILICNHRNLPVQNRQVYVLAHQVLISLIAWMNRNGNIAEHGFRTRCGHDNSFSAIHSRVAEIPILSVFVLVLYLCIRQGRLAARAPVNQAVSAINPAFVVQVDEEFRYGLAAAFVHGKALSPPVTGVAQLPALLRDPAAVLLFPRPSVLQKLLSSELVLVLAGILVELVGYFYLGGNAGVIAARKPQRAVAFHTLPTGQHILKGLVQSVSHVQLPRDIWRRHYDGKRFLVRIHFGVKRTGLLPGLVNTILKVFWIVCFRKILFHLVLLSPIR